MNNQTVWIESIGLLSIKVNRTLTYNELVMLSNCDPFIKEKIGSNIFYHCTVNDCLVILKVASFTIVRLEITLISN